MYLSVPIVGLILWAAFIGVWLGGAIGRGKGAIFGMLAGAGLSIAVAMALQQSEISSTHYYLAQEMIKSDCRMTPLARSILSDKRITEGEYWRLEDQSSAIELGDARSSVNGDRLQQCPSTR